MGTFGATFQPGRDDDPRARALHDDDPVQQAIQILAMRLPSAQGESSLLPDELLGYGRSDWQRYFERRRAAQLAPHFRGATAGTNDKPASSAVVNNVLNALGVAQQRHSRSRGQGHRAPAAPPVTTQPSVTAPAVQAPVAPPPTAPHAPNVGGYGQASQGSNGGDYSTYTRYGQAHGTR